VVISLHRQGFQLFSTNQVILPTNDLRPDLPIPTNLNWYALYVKSRHEYVTQSELMLKGIETFLPSVKRLRHWKDRKKLVDFPLFPGYLFVSMNASPEAYINVLKTRGVVYLISTEVGYPTPVAPEEIHSLRLIIESGQELDIYPHLNEGTLVKVKRGPLQGAEGIIKNKLGQYIFVVNINLLGRSIGVKIHAEDMYSA
jgi:transcription termination/antitermination protein NusG